MKHSFLISAPTSGSGKTTIARGLMALLVKKGMKVQPFKCGPDYIDIKFHAAVCGRPSINLDTFMASREHVKELFVHYGADADVCIVEGMMGFFDGYDRDKGSSAEIASVLNVPVVLVVDAKSAAYSMAALLHGFLHFTPTFSQLSTPNSQLSTPNCQLSTPNCQLSTPNCQLSTLNCQLSTVNCQLSIPHIAGVIFNKVGSERHREMLQQVCDDLQVECFGFLPKHPELEQGSRYLGLDFSEEAKNETLVKLLEENVQWKRLSML